jgi:hypothetical protein
MSQPFHVLKYDRNTIREFHILELNVKRRGRQIRGPALQCVDIRLVQLSTKVCETLVKRPLREKFSVKCNTIKHKIGELFGSWSGLWYRENQFSVYESANRESFICKLLIFFRQREVDIVEKVILVFSVDLKRTWRVRIYILFYQLISRIDKYTY